MFIAGTAIIIVLILWGYLSHASKNDIRQATNHIPGPYNIPLLGCLQLALTLNTKNVFKRGNEIFQQYGSIGKGWLFNRLYIATADAELNEQILSNPLHITKMNSYAVFRQWLGSGLLVSVGRKWHSRRKIITPAFHFKILEQFLEVFDHQTSILIDWLAERADGKTAFDIFPYLCSATLNIIAETAMGTNVNAQTDRNTPYTSAVHEMTEMMAWRSIRPHLHSDLIFTLLYPHKKLREIKLIRILHSFTRKVIEERRKVLENDLNGGHDAEDDVGAKKRMVFLDVILQATIDGKPLTDEDIREEVDSFMFGGHDTVTSALSFILYLLARHPQVQENVLSEVRQVFGEDRPKSLTLMILNELKYMECVIKESLRLYPSGPYIGRTITEDLSYTHSKLGNGIIPAGTQVVIAIYNSMRDPRYYKDPSEFIPERHQTNDVGGGFSYIPFSAGPRNCLGQKYAMFEMKVMLMKIIRAYELLPLGPDVEPIVNLVMRSETGMQLGLRKRVTSTKPADH